MDTAEQAGRRLKDYVLIARREAKIGSWSALSRRTGLSRSTFTDWWKGQTRPNRSSLMTLGAAIDRTADQLDDVYHGRAKPPSGYVTQREFDEGMARMEATLAEAVRRLREERGG